MKDYRLYILHMVDAIEALERYAADGKELFLRDEKTRDAVYRQLEVLGEAAKRIPPEVRQHVPGIPWRPLAGLRDVLIHQYDGIDPEEIWLTITRDIPPIKAPLRTLLS